MKNFLFFYGIILSISSSLLCNSNTPDISWNEFVKASQTRKFQSSDGRIWDLHFHKHNPPLIDLNTENSHYIIRKFYTELQSYDGKTPFAAYEVYVNVIAQKPLYSPDLNFYLLLKHEH